MRYDVLVAANPVWEIAWRVPSIPPGGIAPGSISRDADCRADGGGSALNTACALALAGRRVLAVGRVGEDGDGRAALSALESRGVRTAMQVCPGRTTKRNHLYVDSRTVDTAFQVFVGPGTVLPWNESPPELTDARILLLDRLAASAPAWLRARHAGEGLLNFLCRNSSAATPASEARFRRALSWIETLQVPEGPRALREEAAKGAPSEMRTLPGEPRGDSDPGNTRAGAPMGRDRLHRPLPGRPMTEEQARGILESGVRVLLRTRAEAGVLVQTRTTPAGISPCRWESREVPALPTAVVDPTGAGDAFAAGYIHAVLDGRTPPEAARLGVNWAARACRHLGARGWLDEEPPEA